MVPYDVLVDPKSLPELPDLPGESSGTKQTMQQVLCADGRDAGNDVSKSSFTRFGCSVGCSVGCSAGCSVGCRRGKAEFREVLGVKDAAYGLV